MNKKYIYNIIDNKIDYFNLSEYIKQSDCFISDKLFYAIKINKSITTLDLSLNILYPDKIKEKINIKNIITQISKFINNKQNITTLKISNYDLTLNDLSILFETLQYNTSIKTLDISNNNIEFFLDKKYYDIFSNINIMKLFYNEINETYKLNDADKTNFYQSLDIIKDQLNTLKNIIVKNNSFFKMLLKNKTITTLNIAKTKSKFNLYCYENEINIFNEIFQQNKTIKVLNISYRYYSFDNILNFIKNNKCIENLTISLYVNDNTTDNLELIRKYYNENDYLQKIIIN